MTGRQLGDSAAQNFRKGDPCPMTATFPASVIKKRRKSRLPFRLSGAILGLALSALLFVILVSCATPMINDVTTDLVDPPQFVHAPTLEANRGRDFAYPESFVEEVRASYPDLAPLVVSLPPREAFEQALEAAREMPRWEITSISEEDLVFEGIATTWLFRFKDDFVIRVRAVDGSGDQSRIDMRSKSRIGKSDLGTNAKRIRTFRERLRVTLGERKP
jgi:uncharacterized protein (DUF1499 family)